MINIVILANIYYKLNHGRNRLEREGQEVIEVRTC
jgi:hypothetical protein